MNKTTTNLNHEKLKAVLGVYQKAWETKDADLILTIFTPDATYHERLLQQPHEGHKAIRAYWRAKVIGEQEHIRFTLLHTFVEGNIGIAEWEAWFFKKDEQKTVHIREIAVLEFSEGKIQRFREYWHSERLD